MAEAETAKVNIDSRIAQFTDMAIGEAEQHGGSMALSDLSIPDFAHKVSGGEWQKFNWICHALAEVERQIRAGGARMIINAPPGGGKSQAISRWLPIWYLNQQPQHLCILTSFEATYAAKWGRGARDEITRNPLLARRLPLATSAVYDWELKAGGGMVTAGVGGPITGRRAHLLLFDDPIKNFKQAHSATYQRDLVEWFNSTFYTRAEPGASIVGIMTRWTDKDLTAYLESEHADQWTVLNYPAIAEEDDILGRRVGDPLCPERFSLEDLERIREAVGSYIWGGMYQGHPSPTAGGIFKRSDWQFYTESPGEFDMIVLSYDMAFKDNPTSSKVACHVYGFKGARRYLLDRRCERLSFRETRMLVRTMNASWPQAAATLIEDTANGPAIISDLEREVPGLIARTVKGGKRERAMQALSAQPLVEAGNVYLPDLSIAPWVGEFIERFAAFTGAPNEENDDVDAMSQAMIWYRERGLAHYDPKVLSAVMSVNDGYTQSSRWRI